MLVFDDMTPRYAPSHIVRSLTRATYGTKRQQTLVKVLRYIAHAPGDHPKNCPLVNDCCALELQTEHGSRWFGCEHAFIDSRLRMVVIGCSSKDRVRMRWLPVADAVELDECTRAFLECALWSSNDESDEHGGEPIDKRFTIDDIDSACVRALAAECARFQAENAEALEACYGFVEPGWSNDSVCSPARAGHDFLLTRNGHGTGFFDGGWLDRGRNLTKASNAYKNVDLYVGSDGKVYASGYEGER